MKTSAINAIPEYEDTDALQYGAQMKATVDAIDSRVIARFANITAANSAYGAYTSAGGVLLTGMMRAVAGDVQIYANNAWRGIVHTTVSQGTFFNTTITNTTEVGVATLAVPDPGWPYILDVSAVVMIATQSGVLANVRIRLDSVTGTIVSQDIASYGQPGMLVPIPLNSFPTGTLTGAHSLVVTARKTFDSTGGNSNWNVPAGGSLLNAFIRPSYA